MAVAELQKQTHVDRRGAGVDSRESGPHALGGGFEDGNLPREQLVQDETECPHVDGRRVLYAPPQPQRWQPELLGRHVVRGAGARAEVGAGGGLGDAEVGELDLERDEGREQHVLVFTSAP